jgi:hypothetical protein
MSESKLIAHALWHRDLDVMITVEKLSKLPPDTQQAWRQANVEVLYRIEEPDGQQLSFDFGPETP